MAVDPPDVDHRLAYDAIRWHMCLDPATQESEAGRAFWEDACVGTPTGSLDELIAKHFPELADDAP